VGGSVEHVIRREPGPVPRRSGVGIFAFELEMPARTGGRGLKPRRARRGAVAGRGAETGRMGGIGVAAEVLENPRDAGGRLDAGDDALPAAAALAGLDLDGENPLEALRPRQGSLPVGGPCLATLVGSGGGSRRRRARQWCRCGKGRRCL
jgi:hypothetical protein